MDISMLKPSSWTISAPRWEKIGPHDSHKLVQNAILLPFPICHESSDCIKCLSAKIFLHTPEQLVRGIVFHIPCPRRRYSCIQFVQMLPGLSVMRCHKCLRAVALLHSVNLLIASPTSFLDCAISFQEI